MSNAAARLRPASIEEIVGHDEAKAAIEKILSGPRSAWPHSWLFVGPSGVGKTTFARILARRFGSTRAATRELNAAETGRIEEVRSLLNKAAHATFGSDTDTVIVDECHQLTAPAQQALLKQVEEPWPHVFFVFLTTNPEKLIPALQSRPQRIILGSVPKAQLIDLAVRVVQGEKYEVSAENVELAANCCGGSPRRLINMLELASAADGEEAARKLIIESQVAGSEGGEFEISGAIFGVLSNRRGAAAKWTEIASILKEDVYALRLDGRSVRVGLANIIATRLLGGGPDAPRHAAALDVLLADSGQFGNAPLTLAMHKVASIYGEE